MADTSRKRSRKSKLVPRECAVGEDDLELQLPQAKYQKKANPPIVKQKTIKKVSKQPVTPIKKPEEKTISSPEVDTSVLKKINASSAKKEIEPKIKSSPRKFEINIEVECCDNDDDDDQFDSIRVENELAPVKAILSTRIRTTPISLSRDHILQEADNIIETSPDIADQMLNVFLRNTISCNEQEKQNNTWYEDKIQQVLEEWKIWQFRSFHREGPLFYKCYICTRSWWLLSDFRKHLSSVHREDKGIKISLEKYEQHEVNVLAYHDRLVVIKDIYTEGLCKRCGKDYAAHEVGLRHQGKFYKNKDCTKKFFTCMGLRDHIPTCPVCKVEKPLECKICKLKFDTEDEMNNHLVLCHSVRSDVPVLTYYYKCKKCSERYCCKFLHKCGEVTTHCECLHCFRTFNNRVSLDVHMSHSNKPFECEICDKVLAYSCKKYEHMLYHTDKFMVVRKCDRCTGLNVFLNYDDAAAHSERTHEFGSAKPLLYFPKLVVPSSCVYQSLAEQEASLAEQETIEKGKELVTADDQRMDFEESTTDFTMDFFVKDRFPLDSAPTKHQDGPQSVLIQEEPVDYQDYTEDQESPRLVIKEEPLDVAETQIQDEETDNFEHQITVKEEYLDEEGFDEEYDGDIIKLNFNIEDLLVKQESREDDREESQSQTETQTEDSQDSQEFPRPMKEEDNVNSQDRSIQENEDESALIPDAEEEGSIEADEDSILEPEVIIRRGKQGAKKRQHKYRCTKCGFTANHKEYRAHIEFDCLKHHYKQKDYFCSKCRGVFGSMKKYLSHFEEHGYKYKSCPDCLNVFQNYSMLASHLQSHVKQNFVRVKLITSAGRAMTKPDYQCKKCSETVPLGKFFEHWELHINAQPTHPMKVTSGTPRPQKRGELHETIIKECIARLQKTPKECNYCHRWFKRVNECKRHIIEHLLVDAYNHKHIYHELKCQVCESGFATQEKYKKHMRDHASLPVYKCELCDRTFSDSSNFTKHKKVHNLKVIICDLCGKKFQSKVSLAKHMEKHATTKPIPCERCNKIFYFETCYRRHVRAHHEKQSIGFRCPNCGLRLATLKAKWDHMWNVHKERKQKADCPICHESFRKFSDVRAHARKNHLMEVSVLSVNRASNSVALEKIMEKSTTIKPGSRMETLIVYDSD